MAAWGVGGGMASLSWAARVLGKGAPPEALLSGPLCMSPMVGLGCGGVGLWRVVGGGAASGSPDSEFSFIASSLPCSVPPILLCWCCAVPVGRARIATRLGNSACSVSGHVDMVGGAVVALVVPGTVPQPCVPRAMCAGASCGACGPSGWGCWAGVGPPSRGGGGGDCAVVGAAPSSPCCVPEVPCGPGVARSRAGGGGG